MNTPKLRVGQTLEALFRAYRDNAGPLLTVAAAIFLPITLIGEVIAQTSVEAGTGFTVALSGSAAFLYAGIVAPMVTDAGAGAGQGSPGARATTDHSLGKLFSGAGPYWSPLILAGLLYTLGTTVGVLLLIVPGLILITIWAVTPAAIRLEEFGPVAALGRSRELVRGNGWPVFGLVVTVVLLILMVTLAIQVVAIGIAGEDTGTFVGSWLGIVIAAPPLGLLPTVLHRRLAKTSP